MNRWTLWLNHIQEWGKLNGQLTNTIGAVIWMDDGKPWFVVRREDAVYNVDVREYVRRKGAQKAKCRKVEGKR